MHTSIAAITIFFYLHSVEIGSLINHPRSRREERKLGLRGIE